MTQPLLTFFFAPKNPAPSRISQVAATPQPASGLAQATSENAPVPRSSQAASPQPPVVGEQLASFLFTQRIPKKRQAPRSADDDDYIPNLEEPDSEVEGMEIEAPDEVDYLTDAELAEFLCDVSQVRVELKNGAKPLNIKSIFEKATSTTLQYGPELRELYNQFLELKGIEEPKEEAPTPAPVVADTKSLIEVVIPERLAKDITFDDLEYRDRILKAEGVVAQNAAFLCISGGKGYCLACNDKDVRLVDNSSRRGWSDGVEMKRFASDKDARKAFRSHCEEHGQHVLAYIKRQHVKNHESIPILTEQTLTSKAKQIAQVLDCVYQCMYHNTPLTKVCFLLDTLQKHGGEIIEVLRSQSSHRRLADFIASMMRGSFRQAIVERDQFFSLSIDESTSQSLAKCLVANISTSLDREPMDAFLGLVEIDGKADAHNVMKHLIKCLSLYGFDVEDLKRRLVSITTDGASVMTGDSNGLVVKLNNFLGGRLIAIHCMAHRLELGMGDAKEVQSGFGLVIKIVNQVNKLYRSSSPLRDGLAKVAQQLQLDFRQFLIIHEIRWSNSAYRVLDNFLHSLPAILMHLQEEIKSTTKRKKFAPIYAIIGSVEFVQELLFVMEILSAVGVTSQRLQKSGLSFVEAYERVAGLVDHLAKLGQAEEELRGVPPEEKHNFKRTLGPQGQGVKFSTFALDYATARDRVKTTGALENIKLFSNPKFKRIHHLHFLQKLHEQIRNRILFDAQTKPLYEILKVLTAQAIGAAQFDSYGLRELIWLETNTKLIPDGEGLATATALKTFIRDRLLHECDDSHPMPSLKEDRFLPLRLLFDRIATISPTSAECERLFSLMNRIHTNFRSCLKTGTVEKYMLVRTIGPPPALFDSFKAAVKLLRARDVKLSTIKSQLTPALEKLFERWHFLNARIMPGLLPPAASTDDNPTQ